MTYSTRPLSLSYNNYIFPHIFFITPHFIFWPIYQNMLHYKKKAIFEAPHVWNVNFVLAVSFFLHFSKK